MVCRHYHADNLMWLAERKAEQAVGLLDFQDALIGCPAYDLVSLLEDARRDVSPSLQKEMIEYYLSKSAIKDVQAFDTAYAVLGAQRNSKIVGIFARLAIRDTKPRYLGYLPRVWKHLEHDLSHPALAELKIWMDRVVPQDKRTAQGVVLASKEVAHA
jgi:aminoglycoside/choline kinase family phosphotransferase